MMIKKIIQNWFTPHMCGKTYWIHSLLQIVTYECTTARINGAKPSTIDAWQCFLFDIRDCIKEWLLCFSCPSLSPSLWLDFEILSMCLLFCFVIFWMYVMLCMKKKNVDNKKKKMMLLLLFFGQLLLLRYDTVVSRFGTFSIQQNIFFFLFIKTIFLLWTMMELYLTHLMGCRLSSI